MINKISEFEKKIKVKLNNKSLLVKALTHKSANMNSNNEKLEFLGDRVIGIILSEELYNLYPNVNATYRQQDLNYLEFFVDDDFSGIDGENNIVIKIDDGKPLIFEYNIHQKRVYYPFDDQFNSGSHTLHITAKDNVGNENIIRGSFQIK